MRAILLASALASLLGGCAAPRPAPPPPDPAAPGPVDPARAGGHEGDARGYPVLRDASGVRRALGEHVQWLADGRLHVQLLFRGEGGLEIEERSVLRLEPELVQESWAWSERAGGELVRRFTADFESGEVTAEVRGDDGARTWSDEIEAEPGRTFAGAGWPHALRSVHARLLAGETVSFGTVGFLPEPRAAAVELSFAGHEVVPVGGRALAADRFRVHPVLPWLARLVVSVPDSFVWLTREPPYTIVRWEGPLAQPEDPLVRVDAVSGEPSEAARREP